MIDHERRQIFYWLKKLSSLTAWRRILEHYEAWAKATHDSLCLAQKNGWDDETSLPQAEYALIMECLTHCRAGVARLSKGDKQVFKFNPHSEFVLAMRMLSHWSQMLQRIEWGENGIKKNTPLWPQFRETLTELAQVWGECGPLILEPRNPQAAQLLINDASLQAELATLPFPGELPPVPDPADSIFVRTGSYIPCTGIWEPVDIPKRSMLDVFMHLPKAQPPFPIVGAMNYLHGGASAPQLTVETASEHVDQDATWRLLWRDDRYIDGTLPAEEAEYRFTRPYKIQSRPTVINPQEALLLEKYTSVEYFEALRDIWAKMIGQVEQSLLRDGADPVWKAHVLPNFKHTYQRLCDGYIQLVNGDLSGLRYAHGPMNDFKGQNDFSLVWMEPDEADKYWALLMEATEHASNVCATIEGYWRPFELGAEEYEIAPDKWPEYRLNSAVAVNTGTIPPRAGIYLPDLDNSCLQFLAADMPAPETFVFRGKRDLAHPVTDVVYGQENSFDARPCRWTLVERCGN